jgi:CRISPR-associated endoribonuclease Cas6
MRWQQRGYDTHDNVLHTDQLGPALRVVPAAAPGPTGDAHALSGELVHEASLRWLQAAAPDVADWLHEGQKRRLFTRSSLQFNRPGPVLRQAERENIDLPLDPRETYTIRLTLLVGELLPLFHEVLAHFCAPDLGPGAPPLLQLGK